MFASIPRLRPLTVNTRELIHYNVGVNKKYIHGNVGLNKKSCNDSFFSEWSPSMAYWLGFMYADGNVAYQKSNNSYSVQLKLACFDYDHIDKFRTEIQSNFHLGMRYQRDSFGSNCLAVTNVISHRMGSHLI